MVAGRPEEVKISEEKKNTKPIDRDRMWGREKIANPSEAER